MMKRLVAVALLVAALALVQATVHPTFRFTEEDLESDEALWELYGRWAAHHEVEREPGRFPTFKANVHWQYSKKRMGLNVFGDKSFDEALTRTCLVQVATDQLEQQLPMIDLDLVRPAAADVPSKVDWRKANAVTYVKDQGDCGSCWALATAATLESAHSIKTKWVAFSLSAQYLLDCTVYMDERSNCTGGSPLAALQLVKYTGGIPVQYQYPYRGVEGTCNSSKIRTGGVTVSDWFQLKKFNVDVMKRAVSLQPILVSIGVDKDFTYWGDHKVSGNIYHGPGNSTLTHAVVIVGYDVDDLGGLYWIVKNSWGPRWGDDGYIFISAAANDGFVGRAGVAGILTTGIFVEIDTY